MSYEIPPHFSGTPDAQIQQVYSYLYRLVESLNVAAEGINRVKTVTEKVSASSSGGPVPEAKDIEEVKALINSTAKRLNDAITGVSGDVDSLESRFGTYESTITQTIEETAAAMITQYGFEASIAALNEQAAGFAAYKLETEGFIKQGFVTTDAQGVPQIGIAIGQGLTATKVIIDGQEYTQIDPTQSCAFYTANRVSFRVNGQEVAYVSNRKLYIGDAEITGDIVLGGKWQLSTSGVSLNIRWIGGG